MKLALASLLMATATAAPTGGLRLEIDNSPAHSLGPNPWRQLNGLGPNPTPTHTDEHGNSHFSHEFTDSSTHMGTTSLSYSAVIPSHVKMLDAMPTIVQDLTCDATSLTIHTVADADVAAFADSLQVGDLLIASSGFGCHTHQPSGRDHGRHLHADPSDANSGGHSIIRRVVAVEVDSETVTVTTTLADFSDCLMDSDIDFKWTPPHHGEHPNDAAKKRADIADRARRRELGLDVDAIIEKCKQDSTLDFLGNADLKCTITEDEMFDFYADLFSVNYDPRSGKAREQSLFALDNHVRCDDCYATLNLEVNAQIKTSAYELDKFKVTVGGGVHAETAVTLSDPRESAEAYLNRAFEELDVGGCLPTIEFYVNYIPIRIKPCWDLAFEYEASGDLPDFSVRSGFVFDANATIGVEYLKSTKEWGAIKDWDWDLDFYKPLWDVTNIKEDQQVRLYVLPEIMLKVADIIPLMLYPKPYIGLDFNKLTSSQVSIQRTPSRGQGFWKVFIEKGNGFEDPETIFAPDVYAKVEIMGCTSGRRTTSAADLLYSNHAVQAVDGGALTGIVYNPGCELTTKTRPLDSSPTWNEWLIFENAPMFGWEAVANEEIKISVWDEDSGLWFSDDDKLGDMVFDAAGAVKDGVVFDTTVSVGGGTLKIKVKWELFEEESSANTFIDGWAPEHVSGCWRPDGYADCVDFKELGKKRRLETCSLEEGGLSTCECKGINAHVNYGFDVEIAVGEIDLPFEFEFAPEADYKNQRLFAGIMQEFIIVPTTDLVTVESEGCVAVLNSNTAAAGWIYKNSLDPNTGMPVGWTHGEGGGMGVLAIVGIVAGCLALVGAAVGAVVYKQGGIDMGGVVDGGHNWARRVSTVFHKGRGNSKGVNMTSMHKHAGATAKAKRGSAFLHGTGNKSEFV